MHKSTHDHAVDGVSTWVGHTVADIERKLILETLRYCHGNRTQAAGILGISIRTMRNKLHEYAEDGIEIPPAQGGGDFAD